MIALLLFLSNLTMCWWRWQFFLSSDRIMVALDGGYCPNGPECWRTFFFCWGGGEFLLSGTAIHGHLIGVSDLQ